MSPRKIVQCQNVSCWVLFSCYFFPLTPFLTHARTVYASFLIQFSSLLSSSDQIFLGIHNIVHLIIEELKLIGLPGCLPPLFEFFTSSLPYSPTSCLLRVSFLFCFAILLHSAFSHCPLYWLSIAA